MGRKEASKRDTKSKVSDNSDRTCEVRKKSEGGLQCEAWVTKRPREPGASIGIWMEQNTVEQSLGFTFQIQSTVVQIPILYLFYFNSYLIEKVSDLFN